MLAKSPLSRKTFLFLILLTSILPIFFTPIGVRSQSQIDMDYTQLISQINITRVQEHVNYFVGLGTRATGYPGNGLAVQYIYDRFVEYGLENITFHPFTVPVAIDHGANLTILESGETMRIYPMAPNLVCPSTTPPGGISGSLVYGKGGSLEDIAGKPLDGSIVLLDWYSGNRWLEMADLGAKAVIFIPPVKIIPTINYIYEDAMEKVIDVPFNFPRFYIPEPQASRLLSLTEEGRGIHVKLRANTRWERVKGYNLMGFVRGNKYPEKVIMMSSYYDSGSLAPSYAPGAQEATGIASLLEIAKNLRKNPPGYSVMFVAFGGHHQNLGGVFTFLEDGFYPRRNSTIQAIAERIIMEINLDFSTGSDTTFITYMGNFYTSAGHYHGWKTFEWRKMWSEILKPVYDDINQKRPGGKTYNALFNPGWYDVDVALEGLIPAQPWSGRPYEAEPIYNFQMHSFTITDAFDSRPYYNTPFDTLDRVNFGNLQTMLELSYIFIHRIVNLDSLYVKYVLPVLDGAPSFVVREPISGHGHKNVNGWWYNLKGTVAEWNDSVAWYNPVPNALVVMRQKGGLSGGDVLFRKVLMANDKGYFETYGLIYWMTVETTAWVLDPDTGNIVYAPDRGIHQYAPPTVWMYASPVINLGFLAVFKCSSLVLLNAYSPYDFRQPMEPGPRPAYRDFSYSIRDHVSQAPLSSYGLFGYTYRDKVTTMLAFPPETPVDIQVSIVAERYPLMYLLNSTEEKPAGHGYRVKLNQQLVLDHSQLRYAQAFHWINKERFNILIRVDPSEANRPTYRLFTKVEDLLKEAQEAAKVGDYETYFGKAAQAWVQSRQIYLYVRPKIEDAAAVVPFFALLLLPFVLIAEKLLFNLPGLKKVVPYVAIFMATTGALYLLHPGFSFAASPAMIVVGISNGILLSPIIAIMLSRVRELIKAISIKMLGKHEIEVGRASVLLYGFSVGLENMRKRKLRTSLTVISVLLVVSALVNLTSISAISLSRATRVPYQRTPPYEGICIHRMKWGYGAYGLGIDVIEYLKSTYGNLLIIVPRAWKYTDFPYEYDVLERKGFKAFYNGKVTIAPVLWGLSAEETNVTHPEIFLTSGRWFLPGESGAVILTEKQAKDLGITELPVTITLETIPYTVIGIIKPEYQLLWDIDGEQVTPIKFDPGITPNPWDIHEDIDKCFIIPFQDVIRMMTDVASISMIFKNRADIRPTAAQLAQELPNLAVYSSVDGAVLLNLAGFTLSVWGLQHSIIPIVITTLSIFNIMLGSVYERRREISTYSSVGLNPIHVTFIFLAETIAYALLGSMLGFLLAVTMMRMSSLYLPGAIVLNYSSTWVALSISFAILVTLASVIYPMIKASRFVTPSLERIWKIPTSPHGDSWKIPLPFVLTNEEEVRASLAFLAEYVKAHETERAPEFSSTNIKLEEGTTPEGIRYKRLILDAFLSPYELGVRQNVQAQFTRVEEKWALETFLTRTSGSQSDWVGQNKNFVDLLRKQALMWRSIKEDEKERYRKAFHEKRTA